MSQEAKIADREEYLRSVESKVLGAITEQPTVLSDLCDYLKPNMFFNWSYGRIYEAYLSLYNSGEEVNIITATNWIKKNGFGDKISAYDVTTAGAYCTPSEGKSLALVVVEYHMRRSLEALSRTLNGKSVSDTTDPFTLVEEAQKALEQLVSSTALGRSESLDGVITELASTIKASEGDDAITGVETGLTELDELTSGLQSGDLVILAARPAMGKSALATTIQKNSAKKGFKSVMYSLEMSKHQVMARLVSADVYIPVRDIVKKNFKPFQVDQFKEYSQRMLGLPITINDSVGLSLNDIRRECREIKRRKGLDLILIDYLQLMSGNDSNKNREQEISEISRGLKSIAKELEVPVIALSQLSRNVEQRDNKRPMMSDLRESGAIEQDADMVLFLYRPEYYAIIKGEDVPDEWKGVSQLIVGKYRNGDARDIVLDFDGEHATFRDRKDLRVKLN